MLRKLHVWRFGDILEASRDGAVLHAIEGTARFQRLMGADVDIIMP